MSLVRRVARPLLASIFVTSGVDQLRQPAPKAPVADDAVDKVGRQLPYIGETDPETLVRINGGVQLGAGSLLALGRLPRLSALALAASTVPTTMAAHRFWEFDDPAQRQQQQIHFLKNLSILGGLVIAAMDTEGRPGLGWRARNTAERARTAGRRTRREARLAAKSAKTAASGKAAKAATSTKAAATGKAAKAAKARKKKR